MSAAPGWYPDPQGGYGQLRYWDGQAWTAHTTMALNPTSHTDQTDHGDQAGPVGTNAGTAAASQAAGQFSVPTWQAGRPEQPGGQGGFGQGGFGQGGFGQGGFGQGVPPYAPATSPQPSRRRPALIAGSVIGVLVLVLGVGWIFGRGEPSTASQASSAPRASRGAAAPGQNPSAGAPLGTPEPAPTVDGVSCAPAASLTPAPQTSGAWVEAGGLAYPMPPAPWPAPLTSDFDLPLLSTGAVQLVQVAEYRQSGWAAGLVVGALSPDLGLDSVKQAAKVTADCMVATQYTVAKKSERRTKDERTTVSGRSAWLIESTITLDDPDLKVSSEAMTLVVVERAEGSYSIFWSSIPRVRPDFTAVARACRDGLKVNDSKVI